MRKYQKMGCVRYAANDAKAAELERMGYEECAFQEKEVITISLSPENQEKLIAAIAEGGISLVDTDKNAPESTHAFGNTEDQEKTDSKPGTRRKSGKKGKADPETDSEAPAGDSPAPGGDDNGSDPTDNK